MKTTSLAAVVIAAISLQSGATVIDLFGYGINIDGDFKAPAWGHALQPNVDISGFNDTSDGLGRVSITVTGAGSHYVGMFVDHEINQKTNTFFDEEGRAVGSPAGGQSFEIDEPGYKVGDIIANFQSSSLDGKTITSSEDISMALAWNFILQPGEAATIEYLLGTTAPSGFHLQQLDPGFPTLFSTSQEPPASVFFSSTKFIRGVGLPDGGSTLPLLLCGLVGVGLARKLQSAVSAS